MLKDYFRLGLKNLRRRGIRSWLTLLGIVIGIAAVVSLISLGQGLTAAVNSQFGVSTTDIITVQAGGLNAFGPPGSGVVNPLTQDDADAIEKLDTVEIVIARNIETIKVEFNDQLEIENAITIEDGERRAKDYEFQDIEIQEGRLLEDGDTNKVVLGNNYLNGDKNGFERDITTGSTIKINGESFRVVGIIKKKGSFIFDNVVMINKDKLNDLTNFGDDVDAIAVKVKNNDLMSQAKEDIEKLLRQRRDVKKGEEDFEVQTPEAALSDVNQVLNGVQAFVVLIAFVSIIVGAIGIVNTMTTSVLERRKEIGIMKAVGAKNSNIFLQFFIEAGLMGLIGGIIGIILGVNLGIIGILAINNFIGATTKPTIDFMLITLTLLGSFIIGSVSGITPAMKAAKQNIVEAIRN